MGYTRDVIKGVSWLGGIRVSTRALVLIKTLIIARILTPSQFGVFGIAILLLTFIEIVTETGINIFLVQNREKVDKYLGTAWIISIARGILIAGVIFLGSSFVTNFFDVSYAQNIIVLIALVPIIRGFINPAIINLQKELLFKKEFYLRTSVLITETLVTVFLVWINRSVEALIYGMLLGATLEAVLSFLVIKPLPNLNFALSHFKDIISRGKWITGATILNYFYQNGDTIAVGKIVGATSLGLYDMAYKISLVPLNDFADVFGKVVFPVYVRISEDSLRFRRAYFRALAVVVLVVLPIGIFISIFAKEIILIILGEKWIEATSALTVLGIFGAIRAISVFASTSLFLPLRKQNVITLVSLVNLLGLGITIVPLVLLYGILGAALSALFGTLVTIPLILYFVYKYLPRGQ